MKSQDNQNAARRALDRTTVSGIDTIRGVLAILVLVSHAVISARNAGFIAEAGGFWNRLLNSTLAEGRFWVGGFFFLSGFCIANSVLRGFEKDTYNARLYLVQRVTRIYPLFLIGLAFAVVAWFSNVGTSRPFPTDSFVLSLFNLQNFYQLFPYYRPSWSITNELVYYLLLPLLVVMVGKGLQRIAIWGTVLSLGVVALLGGTWKFLGPSSNWLIPFWSVAAGAVIWLGGVYLRGHWADRPGPGGSGGRWVTPIALVLVVYGLNVVCYWRGMGAWAHILVGYAAIVPFYLLIRSMNAWTVMNSERTRALAAWLGFLSYPLYLFHAPAQGMIDATLLPLMHGWPAVVVCLVYVVLPLAFVALVGVPLEKYFMAKRRSWVSSARARLAPAPAAPESVEPPRKETGHGA